MKSRNAKADRFNEIQFLIRHQAPDSAEWSVTDKDTAEGFGPAEPKDCCSGCGAPADIRRYLAVLDPGRRALAFFDIDPMCLCCAHESAEFYARELSHEIVRQTDVNDGVESAAGDNLSLARNAHLFSPCNGSFLE
jgi:hypothetical protein